MRSILTKYQFILKETAWYTLANAVVQLSSLVGVLFVSRYLGPTNIGLYSFVQNSIAGVVTIFSGFDIYANWHIVQSENRYQELLKYFYQKMVLAIPIILTLLIFSFIFLPRDIFFLTCILILPIITSTFSAFVVVTQFEKQAKLISVTMAFQALVLLLLKLFAVYIHAPLAVFVAIGSIDALILTIVSAYYILIQLRKFGISHFNIQLYLNDFYLLFQHSLYPLIYIVIWFTIVRGDQFFVPLYFNAHALGVYSSAVKVIEMSNVLIVILQSVIFPRIFKINNPAHSRRNMHVTIALYLGLGFIAAASITILAPSIVHLLFGAAFIETIGILRVYAWSIPGLFVSYLFALVFMSQKKFRMLAYHASFFAILNMLLLFSARNAGLETIASISILVYSLSAGSYYLLWRKAI